MKHKAFRYALWSQISLFSGLLLCFIIRPHSAMANRPISYFGNYRATIVPYAAGFLLCAYWLIRTVLALPHSFGVIRKLLVLVAILCVCIPCTPYMISPTFGKVHLTFAIGLLVLELILSILLIIKAQHIISWVGFMIQLVGMAVAIKSFGNNAIIHFDLIGELLVIGGFSLLLMYNLAILETEHSTV